MKRIILSLLGFALISSAASAQSWSSVPSGTTQGLKAVQFIDDTTGWIVGAGGTILKTIDGGATWSAQTSGVTATLNGVSFVTLEDGWAAGSGGTIIYTQDGGTTWGILAQGAPTTFFDISFQNLASGSGVADNFYAYSLNGGNMWNPVSSTWTLNNVDYASTSIGYAAGNGGVIVKTTNGGQTFTSQISGTTSHLLGIDFVSANDGWACGYTGTMLFTTDGGANWNPSGTTGTGNALSAVEFSSVTEGWTCGNIGTILHTEDAGNTWTSTPSGTLNWLQDITFINPTKGFAVGDYGTILSYSDGGSSANLSESDKNVVSIYPNPANDQITIHSEGKLISVVIKDLNGTIVSNDAASKVNISHLAVGVYFVEVTTEFGTKTSKIIRQ